MEEYAAHVTAFLEREAVERNVLLTVIEQARHGALWAGPPAFWWLAATDDVVGACSWTPEFPLLVSSMPPGSARAVAAAALDRARTIGMRLPGVTGPRDVAQRIAVAMAELTGTRVNERMHMLVHDLPAIRDVGAPPGAARLASVDDAPLVTQWMRAFAADVRATVNPNLHSVVGDAIDHERVWLWMDGGQPRSTAARQPMVGGVPRIGGVYTPPLWRGRGYARRLVYEISAAAMATPGVRTCTLNTDASNPVSNRIYRQIGYRPIAEHSEFELVPRS